MAVLAHLTLGQAIDQSCYRLGADESEDQASDSVDDRMRSLEPYAYLERFVDTTFLH